MEALSQYSDQEEDEEEEAGEAGEAAAAAAAAGKKDEERTARRSSADGADEPKTGTIASSFIRRKRRSTAEGEPARMCVFVCVVRLCPGKGKKKAVRQREQGCYCFGLRTLCSCCKVAPPQ